MVKMYELHGSRKSTRRISEEGANNTDLMYVIRDTNNDQTVETTLAASLPATYDGLELFDFEYEQVGFELWYCIAHYVDPTCSWDDTVINFDTTGGTTHVTQSLATASFPVEGAAEDFKGAIGVAGDAVEGVDITIPAFKYSETHCIDDANVDTAYINTLYTLTGRVNDAIFKGFAAGEVLFLGAQGSKRGFGDWEITYNFIMEPNVNVTVDGIVCAKKGHEYLWVLYRDKEDAAAKALVKRPKAVYIEQVYVEDDLSALGI